MKLEIRELATLDSDCRPLLIFMYVWVLRVAWPCRTWIHTGSCKKYRKPRHTISSDICWQIAKNVAAL